MGSCAEYSVRKLCVKHFGNDTDTDTVFILSSLSFLSSHTTVSVEMANKTMGTTTWTSRGPFQGNFI